jgi:hypothetical protein
MSVRLSEWMLSSHSILDECESFFWVLLYMTYRYLPLRSAIPNSMRHGTILYAELTSFFDKKIAVDSTHHVNLRKCSHLRDVAEGEAILQCRIDAVNQLLQKLAQTFDAFYKGHSDYNEKQATECARWLHQTLRNACIPVTQDANGGITQDYASNPIIPSTLEGVETLKQYSDHLDSSPEYQFGPLLGVDSAKRPLSPTLENDRATKKARTTTNIGEGKTIEWF